MFGRDLQTCLESWLAAREAEGLRPDTLRAYRDHVHIFLKNLGDRELSPFTFASVFRDYGKDHSSASVRTIWTTVRCFLKGIGRPELAGAMRKPRDDTLPKRTYSEGQLRALMLMLKADTSPMGYRDYALVSLLRYGGFRASELCGLTLDSLMPDQDAVLVARGKSRFARRVIPLPEPAITALDRYVARGRPKLLRRPTDTLFLTDDGQPLNRNALRLMLLRRGSGIGVHLNAHGFRHTWVTSHVRARTSAVSIGSLAGWSPKTLMEMLNRYGHADLDDLRAAQRQAFG